MATSLEADAFLTRMVGRRGWPKLILSDNGNNYVGAAETIKRLTSNQETNWLVNPPGAPHFGGILKSMFYSTKRAIFTVLGQASVNGKELQELFAGVESLLNSRPLSTVSGDVNDEPVLTSNHLLTGKMGDELAPETRDRKATVFRKRRGRVW